MCGVSDHRGCQLVVSKIRAVTAVTDPEPVDGWQGTILSTSSNAQFDDVFVLAGDYPVQFGIDSGIAENGWPVYVEELENLRDSGDLVEVWCKMICGVPDVNGCQIQVMRLKVGGHEVDPYTGWKSYKNEAYGFRLRYPDMWTLTEMPLEDTSAQGGPVFGNAIHLMLKIRYCTSDSEDRLRR